jgi:hypothetical protein
MIEPTDAAQLQTDTASEPTEVGVQAEHLIAFTGEPWAFWRWSGLRGAGFPAHMVLKVAVPTCAAAADEILAAESCWAIAIFLSWLMDVLLALLVRQTCRPLSLAASAACRDGSRSSTLVIADDIDYKHAP